MITNILSAIEICNLILYIIIILLNIKFKRGGKMADKDLFSALWDGWKIKELIGEGSFGEVYRAEKHE